MAPLLLIPLFMMARTLLCLLILTIGTPAAYADGKISSLLFYLVSADDVANAVD